MSATYTLPGGCAWSYRAVNHVGTRVLTPRFQRAPPDAAILHLHRNVWFLSPEHSLTCLPLLLV